jgi:hypothetical protein
MKNCIPFPPPALKSTLSRPEAEKPCKVAQFYTKKNKHHVVEKNDSSQGLEQFSPFDQLY